MTSKMAQDGPRWLKMAPKMPQEAPRPPQNDTKWTRSFPRRPPKRPNSLKNLRETNEICILTVSLPMAIRGLKMAPRWPKRAPRGAQESPKTAPRAPKNAPRAPQEGSKRRSLGLPRGGANWGPPRLGPPLAPKTAQTGPTQRQQRSNMGVQGHPRGAREGPPKTSYIIPTAPGMMSLAQLGALARPQRWPRTSPDDPKRAPRETPKGSGEVPQKGPQRYNTTGQWYDIVGGRWLWALWGPSWAFSGSLPQPHRGHCKALDTTNGVSRRGPKE